jgi:hypothetical protein
MLSGDKPTEAVHDEMRNGKIPPQLAPAVLAATHDMEDAKAKAEKLKTTDPTAAEQFGNIAASILNGLTHGFAEIYKGSLAEPGLSTLIDPLQQQGIITSNIAALFSDKTAKQIRGEERGKADAVTKATEKLMDERLKDSVGTKVGNFVGGLLPYVGAAIATKGKSIATPVMASLFYTSGYQSTYEDAKSHGASDTQADLTGMGVGAINAVLALPLRTVGKAAEAIFGDSAPKVIQRALTNAMEHGGPSAVGTLLGRLAEQIKAGGAGSEAIRKESVDGINLILKEITKPAAQRVLDVAKTAAGHAALGAGVQISENLLKKTYNPDQGTFEGVPEQALGFAALGGLSKGFEQVVRARNAKQALDLINKRGGGEPPGTPQIGPGGQPPPTSPTEKPVAGRDRTISPTTETPAKGATDETSQRRQDVQITPAGSEPAEAGPSPAEPSDQGGAKTQPLRTDASAEAGGEAGKQLLKVEVGDTITEGDKQFVLTHKSPGQIVMRPADKPDANGISFGEKTLQDRLASGKWIHTKADAPAGPIAQHDRIQTEDGKTIRRRGSRPERH